MDGPNQSMTQLLDRLLLAMNDHDLDGVVSCFAVDYMEPVEQGADEYHTHTGRMVGSVAAADGTRS